MAATASRTKVSATGHEPIGIYVLATHLPEYRRHDNLLAPVVRSANNHLFQPAGRYSRPSIVSRGVTRLAGPAYEAPTAGERERTADLASLAVGKMVAAVPLSKDAVRAVFHAQCTLDQQLVGSGCLRIQDDYFSQAKLSMMIGQLGTAGIPTVLKLALMSLSASQLTSVSASDKWMAPFVRSRPGMVTYGDASAACLAGATTRASAPIAVVEHIVTSCVPPPGDLWSMAVAVQRELLLSHVHHVIGSLLSRTPEPERDELVSIGDGYGGEFSAEAAAAGPMESVLNACPDVHLSSASPLFAMARAVGLAVERGREVRALIWTASPAGHAGAMLVRASPDAQQCNGAWVAPGMSATLGNESSP